jgi:hypothetical protein
LRWHIDADHTAQDISPRTNTKDLRIFTCPLRFKASTLTCMENKGMPTGNHKLMAPYAHRLLG